MLQNLIDFTQEDRSVLSMNSCVADLLVGGRNVADISQLGKFSEFTRGVGSKEFTLNRFLKVDFNELIPSCNALKKRFSRVRVLDAINFATTVSNHLRSCNLVSVRNGAGRNKFVVAVFDQPIVNGVVAIPCTMNANRSNNE